MRYSTTHDLDLRGVVRIGNSACYFRLVQVYLGINWFLLLWEIWLGFPSC